ncbi:hypothetical protein WMF37_30280 [Sorangium sp. So ce291]|uniref:hypothetical protein n=1 Tax=Sorangium sp. So ce291 TaxID=3133294 RepID=UPI003F5DAEE7
MNRDLLCGVAAMLVALPGCDSNAVDWEGGVTSSSAHFRYHAREGDEHACSDVHAALERHLQRMTSELEIEWPDDAVIDYYKFLDQSDFNEHSRCSQGGGGCYHRGEVRTRRAFEPHELIHAYVGPHWGQSAPMLNEGLAVALSCSPWGYAQRTRSWQEVFDGVSELSDFDYVLAGALVTHLLDEHGGVSKFRELYQSLSPSTPSLYFPQKFKAVYGVELETVWSTLLGRQQIPICRPVWACAADELAASDEVGPTCAGSGERVFSTETPIRLVTEGLRLRAMACDGSGREVLLSGGDPTLGAVRGEHWMPALGERFALTRIGEGLDIEWSPVPTRTEIHATAAWSAATCGEPEAIRLRPDTMSTFVMPEAGQTLRLAAERDEQFQVVAEGVALCRGCEEGCADVLSFALLPKDSVLEMRYPSTLGVLEIAPTP